MIHSLLSLALWSAVHAAPVTTSAIDSTVLAQAPAADAKPAPAWTGSVTFGGILTDGNSETRQANATADAEKRRESDRLTLGFLWTYSEERNTSANWNLTDRKTAGRAKYDYFLSEKSYLLAQLSAENDRQADLKLRTTIGVGAGRQFVETEEWKVSAEAGVSSFDEDFNVSPDANYMSARAAYNAAWNYSKSVTFSHTAEVFPSLEDSEDVSGRSDLRATMSLTESMLAQFQWVMDYDNTPAGGKDRVDNRYVVSIGWKF
mgnify:CR=1 FL=1